MRPTLAPERVQSNAQKAIANFHVDIVKEVENKVIQNEWVIVGMKQNPVVKTARKLLAEKNIAYEYVEYGSYFSMWKERLALKLWSGWPTFPQVYHKSVLIGGARDLKAYLKG